MKGVLNEIKYLLYLPFLCSIHITLSYLICIALQHHSITHFHAWERQLGCCWKSSAYPYTQKQAQHTHTHTHTSHPLLCRPRLLLGVSIFQNMLIKYDTIKIVSGSKGILSNDGTMNIVCLAGCTSQGHKRSSDPADVLICHIWMNPRGAKQKSQTLIIRNTLALLKVCKKENNPQETLWQLYNEKAVNLLAYHNTSHIHYTATMPPIQDGQTNKKMWLLKIYAPCCKSQEMPVIAATVCTQTVRGGIQLPCIHQRVWQNSTQPLTFNCFLKWSTGLRQTSAFPLSYCTSFHLGKKTLMFGSFCSCCMHG